MADLYACTQERGIYKQTGGTGAFVEIDPAQHAWQGIAAHPDGSVYATGNDQVWRKSRDGSTFVSLNLPSRAYKGVTVAPNGDVYVCVYSNETGQIYKQIGAAGDFVSLNQPALLYWGMSSSLNGDIYVVRHGDIAYKQTGGVGDFQAFQSGYSPGLVLQVAVSPAGDVWAASSATIFLNHANTSPPAGNYYGVAIFVNGDVYCSPYGVPIKKKVGGVGAWEDVESGSYNWTGICSSYSFNPLVHSYGTIIG